MMPGGLFRILVVTCPGFLWELSNTCTRKNHTLDSYRHAQLQTRTARHIQLDSYKHSPCVQFSAGHCRKLWWLDLPWGGLLVNGQTSHRGTPLVPPHTHNHPLQTPACTMSQTLSGASPSTGQRIACSISTLHWEFVVVRTFRDNCFSTGGKKLLG